MPLNVTLVKVCPEQTVWSAVGFTVGTGLTVISKVRAVPVQLPALGVTVIVAVWAVFGVKLIFPEPEAANPMAGLLFVQSKIAPEVPVKLTETGCPAHTVCEATGFTSAPEAMVTVNVRLGPAQMPVPGDTVMLAVPDVAAAVKLRFPVPLAGNPIAGLLFVHV